jgi:hypothetical protein
MLPIPHVHVEPSGNQWRAAVGFRLTELLSQRLEGDNVAPRMRLLADIHQRSARLAELIAALEGPVSFEIHLASWPSLEAERAGKIAIALRLAVEAAQQEAAVRTCLSHYIGLQAALATHWQEAWFTPLGNGSEFRKLFRPFAPYAAVSLERRRARLTLGEPFRCDSEPIGFQTQSRPGSAPLVVEHLFPWAPSGDDWNSLLAMLLGWPTPQWLVVRMVTPVKAEPHLEQLRAALKSCEQFLAGAASDQVILAAQADQLRRLTTVRLAELNHRAVGLAVLLLAAGEVDPMLASSVGQCISPGPARGPDSELLAGGFSVSPCCPRRACDPFFLPRTEPFALTEAACAFRLPVIAGHEDFGLPVRRSRTLPANLPRPASTESGFLLAINRHRGVDRPIRVSLHHRFKHEFIIGMTGAGKSTRLHGLIQRDLNSGHGVCLIDPHGELADALLDRFPRQREEDLILVDLADHESCLPLNFLRWRTSQERDLVVDDLYNAFDRIYDLQKMGGPIFERYFRGALRLLMGDDPEAKPVFTLLELPLFFQNRDFRQYLVRRIRDPQLADFVEEAEAVSCSDPWSLPNLAPYITGKFTRFLQDELLRRIVGHGEMKLDFCQILDQQKVLILKLGRGRFGAQATDMLMGMLLSRFRCAVMARAAIPHGGRKPFFLYVDEIGSLASDPNFALLLSEARKYDLGLVLATQYAKQLAGGGSTNLLSAVLGNAGTVACFRVGVEDAELLAPVFGPHLTPQDLMNLPNFEGYLRLHLDHSATRPSSIVTQKPERPVPPGRARELSERSRARWMVTTKECEEQIAERRHFIRRL